MTTKMEMSLDDIIKQNKGNRKATGKSQGAPKGGAKRTNERSAKRGQQQRNRKPGGGVQRGAGRGGIRRSNGGPNIMPSHKREAFLGSAAPRRFNGSSEVTKLIVSNLDFGVTDFDILELFGEFGPLKSVGVHYDRSGRSLGSADLIFERRSDAIKAMKQYNGVPLDGREMNIQLATSEIPPVNPIRAGNRLGGNFNKSRGPASNRSNTGRGPRGSANNKKPATNGAQKGSKAGSKDSKPGKAKKAAPPTAEELDAQLDEYLKCKPASASTEGA